MRSKRTTRLLKLAGILFLVGAILVGSFVGYLLIARSRPSLLPSPTGAYQVGRVEYDWIDPTRTDPLADSPATPRKLAIWIWYPATAEAASQPAPYLPAYWLKAQNNARGFQRLSVDHILTALVGAKTSRSHAYIEAPLAHSQSPFPVLIMQPGLGPAIPDYTVYAENLASHGYVVVGVNEPYSSNLVVFADGQVARDTDEGTIADDASQATVEKRMNTIGRVWTADAIFVMNKLRDINDDASSMFADRLDLSRIGLFGHSFGGATAIAVCQRDARCKAGADLDGTPMSDTMGEAVSQPFLFFTEEYSQGCAADKDCRAVMQAYRRAGGPAYLISVEGAKHFNFSDMALHFTAPGRWVLRRIGAIGSIDLKRGLAMSNAYLVAFFDRYLRDIASPLLAPTHAAHVYPEAQLTSKP